MHSCVSSHWTPGHEAGSTDSPTIVFPQTLFQISAIARPNRFDTIAQFLIIRPPHKKETVESRTVVVHCRWSQRSVIMSAPSEASRLRQRSSREAVTRRYSKNRDSQRIVIELVEVIGRIRGIRRDNRSTLSPRRVWNNESLAMEKWRVFVGKWSAWTRVIVDISNCPNKVITVYKFRHTRWDWTLGLNEW